METECIVQINLDAQQQQIDNRVSSPEYIVLDEDDNEIKLSESCEELARKKRKLDNDADNDIKIDKIEELNKPFIKYDINNLPTLLPASEIKYEKLSSRKTYLNNKTEIEEFLDEWKNQDLDELLLVDDYLYKDPLIKKMKPHESYAYVLGLNLVLENVTSSYKVSLNWLNNKNKKQNSTTSNSSSKIQNKASSSSVAKQPDQDDLSKTSETIIPFSLNLGIENEKDFLENLDKNTNIIESLNKTLVKTQELKYNCKMCNFRTDSLHILDQHLTHPHNINTKTLVSYRDTFTTLKCNFCDDFKTYLKDEYAKHIIFGHKRSFIYFKPLSAYMCSLCEYECREKFRFLKHQQQCININNQEFLKNVLKPTLDDELDYEFLFPNSSLLTFKKRYVPPITEIKLPAVQVLNNSNANSIRNFRPILPNIQVNGNSFIVKQLQYNQNDNTIPSDKIASILNKNNLSLKYVKQNSNPNNTTNALIPNSNFKFPNNTSQLLPNANENVIKDSFNLKHKQPLTLQSTSTGRSISYVSNILNKNSQNQQLPQQQLSNLNNKINPLQKQDGLPLFPKFLICPVCHISISNLIDLTTHLRLAHNLNEKSANTIINEKVIPQLSKFNASAILKENSNNTTNTTTSSPATQNPSQAPSIINISNIKKIPGNTVSKILPNVPIIKPNSQFISKSININSSLGPKLTSKIKVIDYVSELKLINNYLTMSQRTEGKLNEVKTIAGKCYLCDNKTVYDLLQHFDQQHGLAINNKRFETLCILCGEKCSSREHLIQHQYISHKIISFISLNKVFTLSKFEINDEYIRREKKECEVKLRELKLLEEKKKNQANLFDSKKINSTVSPVKPEITPVSSSNNNNEVKSTSKINEILNEDNAKNLNNSSSNDDNKLSKKKRNLSAITDALVAQAEAQSSTSNSSSANIIKTQISPPKTYICNECKKNFDDFYAYCSHLINEHQDSNKSSLRCPICKNLFNKGEPYQTHIRTHLKICQIELKRLNINKPKINFNNKSDDNSKLKPESKNKLKKNINNKDFISTRVTRSTPTAANISPSLAINDKIDENKKINNLNFNVSVVLNRLTPAQSNVRKMLSDEIIVIDE